MSTDPTPNNASSDRSERDDSRPSNLGPTLVPRRDRWIGVVTLLGVVAYLLACIPAPVSFSPNGRYYAYVAVPTPTDPGKRAKIDGDDPLPARLIVVDRKLRITTTPITNSRLLHSVDFVDSDTLIVGQLSDDSTTLEFSSVDRSSGKQDRLLSCDISGLKKQNGLDHVAAMLRITATAKRAVVNFPTQDQIACVEIDLATKEARLLPIPGFLPILSGDGSKLMSIASDQWEPLAFDEPRSLDVSKPISIAELFPAPKETEPDEGEKKDEEWWIEIYTLETGKRVRAPLTDFEFDDNLVLPILDDTNDRLLFVDDGKVRGVDLTSGRNTTLMDGPEGKSALCATDGATILALVEGDTHQARLERWHLATGERNVVLDGLDSGDWKTWGVSPNRETFVLILSDSKDANFGAASVEIEISSGEMRITVPTAADGVALLDRWTRPAMGEDDTIADPLKQALFAQALRSTRTLISASPETERRRFTTLLEDIVQRPHP